ncbi:MAG: NAD(P)H-dependent oxidoreductase [Clostridia bacterium]|nr:NAD(P)H-dependent oxidoreductase [Clostridia bacterium]
MKITVINGTEKHGVTWRLKESFLEPFRGTAEITEFVLPRDCPNPCSGCAACCTVGEARCKDAAYVQPIEQALLAADLLVFTSPAYVFHATGAMKTLLDHFAYRWMPHRPAGEMFGKRAVILTQCLGAGAKSAAKDIADSLSWWGVSDIRIRSFRLLADILWDKLPEKKRAAMTRSMRRLGERMLRIDYGRPARTRLAAKARFLAVRMLHKRIGKDHPDSRDEQYWQESGWLGTARPWK